MSKTMCQEQNALWEYRCIQNCEQTAEVLLRDAIRSTRLFLLMSTPTQAAWTESAQTDSGMPVPVALLLT